MSDSDLRTVFKNGEMLISDTTETVRERVAEFNEKFRMAKTTALIPDGLKRDEKYRKELAYYAQTQMTPIIDDNEVYTLFHALDRLGEYVNIESDVARLVGGIWLVTDTEGYWLTQLDEGRVFPNQYDAFRHAILKTISFIDNYPF